MKPYDGQQQTDAALPCGRGFSTCILQAYEVSDLIPRTQATATHWPEVLKNLTQWLTKIPKHLSWRLQNPQTHVPGDMELLV